jgi:hypothetical protein
MTEVLNTKFHENMSNGSRANACGQTDGYDEGNRRLKWFYIVRTRRFGKLAKDLDFKYLSPGNIATRPNYFV